MGSSSSSDQRFYNGKQLLQGEHIFKRGNRTYDGEFEDGWFVKGSIEQDNGSYRPTYMSGKFKFNQLLSGSGEEDFQSLFKKCVPFEVQDVVTEHFNGEYVYVVGQYDIDDSNLELPHLTGHCTIYYDIDDSKKFIDGEFEEGLLTTGTIYSNDDENSIVARGEFAYHDDEPYVRNGTIFDREYNMSILQHDGLYLKINPLILDAAHHENNYNGSAKYYLDLDLKHLVMNCDLVEGVVCGDVIVFQGDKVLIEGNVLNNKLTNGMMLYAGFYTVSEFDDDGNPHGIAELYHDSDRTNKYADVCFDHGEYQGKFTQYDSSGNIVKTLVCYNGEFINDITEDTQNRFTIVLEESKTPYLRYKSNDDTFVRESELLAALESKSSKNIVSIEVWLSNQLADDYENIKKIVGADLLNVIKSRCGKIVKDNTKFARELLSQLRNPSTADLKNARDKKMRDAFDRLNEAYDSC